MTPNGKRARIRAPFPRVPKMFDRFGVKVPCPTWSRPTRTSLLVLRSQSGKPSQDEMEAFVQFGGCEMGQQGDRGHAP
jgi:hypothetical protein